MDELEFQQISQRRLRQLGVKDGDGDEPTKCLAGHAALHYYQTSSDVPSVSGPQSSLPLGWSVDKVDEGEDEPRPVTYCPRGF